MATSTKTLALYRELLRTLQRWPSVKRPQVTAEIRAEFRQNRNEADASKCAKMIDEAESGLRSLRQQCGMSADGNDISYAYDEALSKR